MEHTKMLSAGIDIGTSTSQVIFSRLTVENTAGYFSVPSVSIIGKEVIYQSPVYRTPLLDGALIDGDGLAEIIAKEYQAAGVSPEQVETGAVIITGESARKENAALVLERLSRFAGDFVVSTAGPDLESVIAGQGSGAQKFSEENGAVVANLDIGGGTTNVVIFDGGEACGRGCLDIGGRQATVGMDGSITYLSPSAARIAKSRGLFLKEGEPALAGALQSLCGAMAELLEQLLGAAEETPLLREVETRGSARLILPMERPIRFLCFSGGVADCLYHPGQETFAYGDIGVLLAEAIRKSRLFQEFQVIEAAHTIRATVIGAGSYTTTISGSTIAYSAGLFPMKNVPVLKLSAQEEEQCWGGEAGFLRERVKWFLGQNDVSRMVLALEGRADPDYGALKRLAQTLAKALGEALPPEAPMLVIVKADVAKALGQLMKRALPPDRSVVSVDAIRVEQNNFVDFGRPIMDGLVIPVVVKTLIFG